jgi:hypothetical protein
VNLDKRLAYLVAEAWDIAMLLIDELQQAKRRQYERIVVGELRRAERALGGFVMAREGIVTSPGEPGRVDLQLARRRRKPSRLSGLGIEGRIFSVMCREVDIHADRVYSQLCER